GALYARGLGVPKDAQKAQTYYKKACDLGYEQACTLLSK
ncbi:SEL1-like repeat protein, partial [Helicobacter vulpis]